MSFFFLRFFFFKCIVFLKLEDNCFSVVLASALPQCESATSVHTSALSWSSLPPPDPIPPFEVVAEHWLSSLCYIELPVAICFAYGNVYVSVLLSQFVSPSPPHAVYTSLFSISVSLFLPCKSTCLFLNFFKLRYSHTVNVTLLKCTVHRFLVCSQSCATITTIQLWNTSITSKRNPVLISGHFPSLLPQPPATANPPSVSVDLPVLDISYRWTHTSISVFFHSTSCFLRLLHVIAWEASLLFKAEWPSSLWKDHILLIHSSGGGCLFLLLVTVSSATLNICVQEVLCMCFRLPWVWEFHLGVELLGHFVKLSEELPNCFKKFIFSF